MKTRYHVTPLHQLSSILEQGLIPQLGPRAQSMRDETIPAVFLFATQIDADNAVMNWLGDEFDGDVVLALLEVQVDDKWEPTEGYEAEVKVTEIIPPANIKILSENY